MSLWEQTEPMAGAKVSLFRRLMPVFALVALCWLVFLFNNLLWGGQFNRYGIVPRHLASLPGLVFAPFLHGSFQHLLANTVPLLVLGGIICLRSGTEFVAIAFAGIFLTGALTWFFARTAIHIGASGLIFCFFGYLASLAWFRRTFGTLLLSAVCILAYGGMLRGLVPTSTPISWEGHVAGLVSGIGLAWLSSKLNPRPKETALKQADLTETLKS